MINRIQCNSPVRVITSPITRSTIIGLDEININNAQVYIIFNGAMSIRSTHVWHRLDAWSDTFFKTSSSRWKLTSYWNMNYLLMLPTCMFQPMDTARGGKFTKPMHVSYLSGWKSSITKPMGAVNSSDLWGFSS